MLHVPEVLRERLGPQGAQALVELLDRAGRETRDEVVLLAEERFSRRVAEAEIRFERRVAEGMASLETRLTDRIAGVETKVVRWTFAFWTTQFLLLGILFAFFKP